MKVHQICRKLLAGLARCTAHALVTPEHRKARTPADARSTAHASAPARHNTPHSRPDTRSALGLPLDKPGRRNPGLLGFWLLLAALSLPLSAHAQGSCSSLTTTTSPALPASFSMSQPVGTVVWSGNFIITGVGCTSSYNGNNWFAVPFTTTGNPISTSTSTNSGLTINVAGTASVALSTGNSCAGGNSNFGGVMYYISCLGTFSNASFTATFPATIKIGTTSGSSVMSGTRLTTSTTFAWWGGVVWQAADAEPGSGGVGALVAPYTGTIPAIIQSTCTLVTSNVAVTLPTVGLGSLSSPGATSGLTPFTLSWSGCTANGGASGTGFTATQTWSFSTGPVNTYVANSASTPAANVYVQILDANMTAIANGAQRNFTIPQAGGSISQTFYARYISSGVAGAGGVRGVLTFDVTYN